MRRHSIPVLAVLACLAPASAFAAGNAAAPITDVLLFPGGATITRTVQVSPGITLAVLAGLPARFDTQTLRAEASAGIRLGDIQTTDTAKVEAVNPAEADLEAKITVLQDKSNALDGEAKSAQLVVDFLGSLGGGDAEKPEARRAMPADGKSLSGVVGVMAGEAGKAYATLQRVAVQQREIGRRIEALQRDLNRLRTGARDSRTVTIKLAAERPGTLKVSYQVANAGWKPAYRAALDSEASTLDIERQAIISQKTGEDWTDVRLTLSTSQPRQATTGREPQPWLLSYRPPEPAGDKVAMPAYAMAPAPMPMAAPHAARKAEAEPAYVPPTFESRSMFATEFRVPAPASLPADGREVAVALAKQGVAVKQYLQTAPRIEAAAYVTAEAATPEGDWPAGDMQLFRDGSYIGHAYWNPEAHDRLVLGFGRDDQVRVAVAPLKSDSGSAGVFGNRRQKRLANAFSITNHHRRAVEVTVLEASPVATADEVKVKADFAPKPGHEAWEEKQGVVAWDLTVAPGKTEKITTDYLIEYPGEGRLIE